MRTIDVSHIPDSDFRAAADIADEAGVDFKDCYQCGKCTAGCPMVQGMDLMPREVIRYLQLGLTDEVLRAKTPWVCAQCVVCSARCPQNVDITSVMRAVRHASKDAGYQPIPEADKFEDLFIKNVRAHGRSNEQYLAAKFNFASGHLFQDVSNAPKMMKRGMIGMKTHNIEDRAEVAALIDRVLSANGASKNGAARKAEAAAEKAEAAKAAAEKAAAEKAAAEKAAAEKAEASTAAETKGGDAQ